MTTVLLFATDMTVLLFHVIFVLLTLGAFFWELSAFVWRAGFWVAVTTFGVLLAVFEGQTPAEELIEIPLLSTILVGVFMIARHRSQVQAQLLEQDQAFLGAVLENMEDAVVACDAEGKLAFSNSAARLFHGLPSESLPLEQWSDHHEEYAAEGAAPIANDDVPISRALRGDRIKDEEILMVPAEGPSRFLLVSGNRMTSTAGELIGAVVVMRDITERKRSERELEMRARQGEIVASLGRQALASYDLYALMDQTVSMIARTLSVECCGILELVPGADELLLISGEGWAEEAVGEMIVSCDPNSLADYTLTSDEPIVVDDLRAETGLESFPLLEAHGAVSGVSLVIHGQEEPFGILCAFSRERRTFTRDDVHFLQAVANVLTSAYERKVTEQRLYEIQEEERERIARDLHDTALQDISHALRVLERDRPEHGTEQQGGPRQEVRALRRAVRDLKNSIYDLRPKESQEQSFVKLVESLVQINREISPELEIDLSIEKGFPTELPQPAKTEVLRIIQEALVNARRHAAAAHVQVGLRGTGDVVEVEVDDDGRGFEPETALGGLGLGGMRERALRLGGDLDVHSEFGEGTRVRFTISRSQLLGANEDLGSLNGTNGTKYTD